jgi:hypothetical protein
MDRFHPRKRSMLAERWPLFALAAVLLAGITAGIVFGIAQRRGITMTDMNSQLDEMFDGGHTDNPAI